MDRPCRKSGIFLLMVCAFALVRCDEHAQECQFWKQMATNLSNVDRLAMPFGTKIYMQCQGGCANIICSGNMKQSVFGGNGLDVDFCFGVQLNHCEEPVRMQYYLDLPKQNIKTEGNITHNDTYELPVPTSLSIVGDTKMILFVEMVLFNESFVKFGVTAKVRMMIANRPTFPFQKTMFPETLIDIPVCPKDKSVLESFKAPPTCTVPPPPNPTPTSSTLKPSDIKSDTYHKSCEIGTDFCNGSEVCKSVHDKGRNGVCECLPDADMREGYCTLKGSLSTSTKEIVTTILPILSTNMIGPAVTQASTGSSQGKHLVPIVIGSVVSVVVLLAVGIFVIIFIGRRRRVAQYRDRQQLLSDDMMDDEDDTNVIM